MQGDIVIQLRRIADALEKNSIDCTDKKIDKEDDGCKNKKLDLDESEIRDLSYCMDVIKSAIRYGSSDLSDAMVQRLVEANCKLGSIYVRNLGLGKK